MEAIVRRLQGPSCPDPSRRLILHTSAVPLRDFRERHTVATNGYSTYIRILTLFCEVTGHRRLTYFWGLGGGLPRPQILMTTVIIPDSFGS